MKDRVRWQHGVLCAVVLFASTAALGAEPEKSAPTPPAPSRAANPTPTPEQRQKMAAIHEKMAACLRSDQTVTECRTEMWSSCQAQLGEGGCPMMRMGPGMMGGGGMMGPGMMRGGPAANPAPAK